MKIEAKEGFTYRRIHDGFIMGKIIYLGIDYSTGEPREDKAEYYEEVKDESISRHMWLEEVATSDKAQLGDESGNIIELV